MPTVQEPRFPILRWFSLLYVLGLLWPYWHYWGGLNFMQLCDVALFISVVGWWTANSLLLSSQILAVFLIHAMWCADAGTRLVTGHGLVGDLTKYMWDGGY